jgi:hypothetical protein
MSDPRLNAICDLIQVDPGNRGLRTDPEDNLITRTAGDFAAACESIAAAAEASIAIVTGFYILRAEPPCGETDGPLGALFLARALAPLGIRVCLVTDGSSHAALEAGLDACGLAGTVALLTLPPHGTRAWVEEFWQRLGPLTHLVALERVGPSHIPQSIRANPGATDETMQHFRDEVASQEWNRCHNMRGSDITQHTADAHLLFEDLGGPNPSLRTIGIGDGGNEIGMGKVPWEVLRGNIPRGGLVACRVPTDLLIVAGVSNWGAYGLAAGVRLLRGASPDPDLFGTRREQELLQIMVDRGPLVDGVTCQRTATVDGLPFDRYAEVLARIGGVVAGQEVGAKP